MRASDPAAAVLLYDKPPRLTSHDVVAQVRRERGCKAGHAGTLDPFATGLLLILIFSIKLDWLPFVFRADISAIKQRELELARKTAKQNISVLAEAVRQGYTIVTAEPSAALCLKIEYPQLIDDEESKLVADNTMEACQYLWAMHAATAHRRHHHGDPGGCRSGTGARAARLSIIVRYLQYVEAYGTEG